MLLRGDRAAWAVAAAAGGGRDALSYGVSFATTRSHQLARGGGAVNLLSQGRGAPRDLFSATSRNSQGRARCCSRRSGPPGRCSGCGRRAATLSATGVSFATTRSHQLARGAPGVLSLRHFRAGSLLSLGAWVPKKSGAAKKMAYAAQLLNNALTECLKRGRVNLLSQGSRAAPRTFFPQLSANSQGRRDGCSRRSGRLGGAGGLRGGGPRRSQLRGQLRHEPDRTSWLGGLPAVPFSPAFRAGSLYIPLARGCRRIWRAAKKMAYRCSASQ